MNSETKTFYAHEYASLSETMKGPLDSFKVPEADILKEHAVETGTIEAGAFSRCAVFSDQEDALLQKKVRYDLKRSQNIYEILEEAEGMPSLDTELTEMNINFDILRAVLIESARKMNRESADGSLTERHADLYRRTLEQAQADLYPAPDQQIISYTTDLLVDKIAAIRPERLESLQSKYPFLQKETTAPVELISEETKQAWHDTLHEIYDPVFARVKETMGDTFSNATLVQATTEFMKEVGMPMTDDPTDTTAWYVESRDDVSGFRIEPAKLRVLCGKRSKEITWEAFEQLMMHEVIIHVTRAENGRKTGYKALQEGMPGNQETEEGTGLLTENLWANKSVDALGRDHYRYMAVCYADGALDGVKHTETETLDFVTDMIAGSSSLGKTTDFETKKQESRVSAYDHVFRAFRGMPEGFVMYSNLAYLSGKLKMLTYLNEQTEPPVQTLQKLQAGKFNPLDEKHTMLMEAATEKQ